MQKNSLRLTVITLLLTAASFGSVRSGNRLAAFKAATNFKAVTVCPGLPVPAPPLPPVA